MNDVTGSGPVSHTYAQDVERTVTVTGTFEEYGYDGVFDLPPTLDALRSVEECGLTPRWAASR